MLEQAQSYRAIVLKGDGRKRKNGGSPRSHIGDAFSYTETDQLSSEFGRLQQGGFSAKVIIDETTLSWLNMPNIAAIILHDGTQRQIGEIHRKLAKAGLHNETKHTIQVSADKLKVLKAVGKKVKP